MKGWKKYVFQGFTFKDFFKGSKKFKTQQSVSQHSPNKGVAGHHD